MTDGRTGDGSYGAWWWAVGFEVIQAMVWLPASSRALRRRILDEVGIGPGTRVLELGCGTGLVTAEMVRRGARVTAVDQSPAMLHRARRRAPAAEFVQSDILDYAAASTFDRVLFAFVLHELESAARVRALEVAGAALAPGGVLGIADFAAPPGLLGGAWRRLVCSWEPASVSDVFDGALIEEVRAAGLTVRSQVSLAGGRACVITAARR
ncbi:MAG TPA: class I SAM-dependent methyltransferase [Longimicrobiaceae bacterium]|nr:class I SAM-dependent methyltransferase [Longimicrobiaceae bacterium]